MTRISVPLAPLPAMAEDLCAGIFATTRHRQPDGTETLHCDRADPRVHISSLLLGLIAEGGTHATVALRPGASADDYAEAVLRIPCDNRTVIYRLIEPCGHGAWRAEFPD